MDKNKQKTSSKNTGVGLSETDEATLAQLSQEYTPEQIAQAIKDVREEENKKRSRLTGLSYFWTLVSTVYAIVSVCVFIGRGWVEHTLMYVLVALLALYVAIFVIMLVLMRSKKDSVGKHFKYYRKAIKLFKAVSNILLLAVSAVSMAGIAEGGMELSKWVMFAVTFAVAVVQLGLKIALLIIDISHRHIAKKYDVKIVRYVNGTQKRKTLKERIIEKSYKD